jgi:hypothetical protein
MQESRCCGLLKDLKQVDITEGRNNYYDLDSIVCLTIPVMQVLNIGMPAAMVLVLMVYK